MLRVCVCMCMLSCAWLFAIPWTVVCQVPLSIEFSGQEYWSGFPFPIPRDLPNPGIKPRISSIGKGITFQCGPWESPSAKWLHNKYNVPFIGINADSILFKLRLFMTQLQPSSQHHGGFAYQDSDTTLLEGKSPNCVTLRGRPDWGCHLTAAEWACNHHPANKKLLAKSLQPGG